MYATLTPPYKITVPHLLGKEKFESLLLFPVYPIELHSSPHLVYDIRSLPLPQDAVHASRIQRANLAPMVSPYSVPS